MTTAGRTGVTSPATTARRFRLVPVLGLVATALTTTGTAQQTPTFRVGVDVVQLDVTVLDRDGRPVHGLTAADFTVLENGAPQPIVSLEHVELPAAVETALDGPAVVESDVVTNQLDARRLVAIVFDDANAGHGAVGRDPWILQTGRQIARDIVARLGPQDIAAVAFTFAGRPQNFTADRAKLLAAIDSFVPQGGSAAGLPLGCMFRGAEANCVLSTLRQVAESLPSSPPRRKILVFISQGDRLPFRPYEGDEALSERLSQADRLQALLSALQRANVTVYAYSPGGLQIRAGNTGDEALRGLAEYTGGRATISTNAPWTSVPAMFEDTRSYYLVGFETAHADGRFHAVDVRVSRPDVTVRTRAGYFAPSRRDEDESEPDESLEPVERALTGGLPVAALPLSAVATARPVPGAREAEVAVVARLDVPAAPGGPLPRVDLLTLAFDTEWRERGFDRRTVEISPPASAAPVTTADIVSTLRLRPGRYELRVAADSGGRAGSVYLDLEVPDFARERLSLGGPIVHAGDTDDAAPTARRLFARRETIRVRTDIVQGGRGPFEPVSVAARIVDPSSREVWRDEATVPPDAFGTARTVPHVVRLPLDRLTPGTWVLTLEASRGDRTLTRHVRFDVR